MHTICNAKSKSTGVQCKAKTVNGTTKCHYHGGRSKGVKGNKHPATPGSIYSQYLSTDDLKNFSAAADTIGNIDVEIQLVKMQLARVIKAQSTDPPDDMQLSEVSNEAGPPTEDGEQVVKIKRVHKRRDFDVLIDRFTGRIASLERDRLTLVTSELENKIKQGVLDGAIAEEDTPQSKRLVFESVDGRKQKE